MPKKIQMSPSLIAGAALVGAAVGWFSLKRFLRLLGASMTRDILKIFMTDTYDENMLEFVSASTRYGPLEIAEANLRAETGKVIQRPLGTPRRFPDFDEIMFDMAQLRRLPAPLYAKVDTKLIIGKRSLKPIICDMPMIVSGMAYGEALSEKAKIALAKGAAMAGTASVTGEGPWLEGERKAARCLILQLNRSTWNKEREKLKRADAIEIQLGQGALGGGGHVMASTDIDEKLRSRFGLPPGKDAPSRSRQPGVNNPKDLARLVSNLKEITGGTPIGVKMGASAYLETELALILEAGIDFISLDGAEAATKGAPPILSDDFGLPSLIALCRAVEFIRMNGYGDKTTLLIGGKIRNPGQVLKAIAIGADGVFMGSGPLFAVAHTQILSSMPLEPPTQTVWYDGKFKKKFNMDEGAKSLCRFLTSMNEELKEGVKGLGKYSVRDVCKEDMVALDRQTAEIVGLRLAWERLDPDRHLDMDPESGKSSDLDFPGLYH